MEEREIQEQLRRYNSGEDEPPYQGAVPDWFKLNSSIQTNPPLWWGETKCSFCEYGAIRCEREVYFCDQHVLNGKKGLLT